MNYAACVREASPGLAEEMMWAWQANGAMTAPVDFLGDVDFLNLDPSLAPRDPKLRSEVFPGLGAILRANVGDPQNEAMLAYRTGFQMSHWEPDHGVPRQMTIAVPAGSHTFGVKPFAYPLAWRELEW
jgi:hypothetical protein